MQAAIYFRRDTILIHALHRTTAGVLIAGLPALAIARSADANEVAGTLRRVLESTGGIVAHPTDWKGFGTPVLSALGVRTWASLQSASRYCVAKSRDGVVVITPTRNGGRSGNDRGFHELSDAAIAVPLATTDLDLRDALARAEAECC